MDRLVYWIWLSLACTPGSVTFANLIAKFGDAEAIYNATDRQIRSSIDPKISDCSALYNKDTERAEEIYNFCREKNVGIVTYNDEEFPKLLRRIEDPPVLLYYRGHLPDWNQGFRLAMVGTRDLSSYGRRIAYGLAHDFATIGGYVVSGMARGIDGVCLAAALNAGGTTIAVLGSGIDVCYPPEHLTLAREIVKKGCIFTEYPPGTQPRGYNFPVRNRLISGMCEATVVIEAGENSGALITGRRAMKQGRQVFAVPAIADNPKTIGTNLLIKSGARICMDITEIVEDFVGASTPRVFDIMKLEDKPQRNILDVLSRYKVAANTYDDPVFTPSGRRERKADDTSAKKPAKKVKAVKDKKDKPNQPPEPPKPKMKSSGMIPLAGFTPEQFAIFEKIPVGRDVPIESLVDENLDLKTVTRYILKLEMGGLIVVLPGDRVMRNK